MARSAPRLLIDVNGGQRATRNEIIVILFWRMGKRSISEWGRYDGDQHGQSRFYIYRTDRIVTHQQSLAKQLKIGSKVVLTVHYTSKKSTGTLVQVHDPQSVISGTGTVASVDSDFGFIRFDHQHQPELAILFSDHFEHPKNRCGTRLDSLLPVGSLVQFDAIPEKSNGKAQYCAVRANLVDECVSAARVIKDQQGIIVQIVRDRSLLVWSKELGTVYGPKTNLDGDRDHDLQVGQWLVFDARQQPAMESTRWFVIKARQIDNRLKFKTTTHARSQWHTYLEVIDCLGVVTSVFGSKGLLWSAVLGRVLLRKETKGWTDTLEPGTLVIFNAERIKPFQKQEDIRWQATSIKPGCGAVDTVSGSIQRCRAQMISLSGPSSGMLYKEGMGKISFTAMDLSPHVPPGAKFRNLFEENTYFDVRFVPGLSHWPVKWCALWVKILNHQVQVPQQVVAGSDEEDTFAEQLDTQLLEEIQESEQEQSSGIQSDLTTSVQGRETPEMKDAECQTEALPELALFRLICSTRGLLDVMRKNHKEQMLVMTQLVRHKFIPNQLGAKVEVQPSSSLEQRNVSSQTAPRPESELANRLIGDEEMFTLVMDIDQKLLMSIP